MVENATLVGREHLLARRAKTDVEDAGAALLDVDDVPRREVDQSRGDGIVGHAEAVGEEVHDRRRLGTEVERPRTDRRVRRGTRDEDDAGGGEPADGRGDGDERQEEIRFAGQAGIVSAEADGTNG